MDRRIVLLPLLALAGGSLSGCIAVAIPALAGTAMVGSRLDGEGPDRQAPGEITAAAAAAASVPAPSVSVMPATQAAAPVATSQQPAPAPAPAPANASALVTPTPVTPSAPAPAPANSVALALPGVTPAPPRPELLGFARFVRYGRGVAAVSAQATGPLSAMLADPIALDGRRKRCDAGEQPVAIIDLDPAGTEFTPPAVPVKETGVALGLAVLREAGVKIAWVSDVPVSRTGAVRSALEQTGLDPRGEDIVSLRRDPEDRKQARKESLAANSCVVAIAGDEKSDFDERFRYLKNPEAGAALETAIGDGWFLIEPLFPAAK